MLNGWNSAVSFRGKKSRGGLSRNISPQKDLRLTLATYLLEKTARSMRNWVIFGTVTTLNLANVSGCK